MVIGEVKINLDVIHVLTNGVKKEVKKLIIKNTTNNGFITEEQYQRSV